VRKFNQIMQLEALLAATERFMDDEAAGKPGIPEKLFEDHPRNHALIATTAKWELSPAYDLTPNPLTSQDKRDLAMTRGTFNRYANRPGADLSLQVQNIE